MKVNILDIEPGDIITFQCVTRWSGKPATRVVRTVSHDRVTVKYGGHKEFVVRDSEITDHVPQLQQAVIEIVSKSSLAVIVDIPRDKTIEGIEADLIERGINWHSLDKDGDHDTNIEVYALIGYNKDRIDRSFQSAVDRYFDEP
jgi:hypothetical protein